METKTCTTCGGTFPLEQFARAKRNRNGRGARCKPCHLAAAKEWQRANPTRHAEHQARANERWLKQNPEYYRRNYLSRQFGMELEDYHAMLEAQGGGCAICGKKPKDRALPVDHCHTTGRVRGILCDNCNRGIGRLGLEIPGRLERFAAYLFEGETHERASRRSRGAAGR